MSFLRRTWPIGRSSPLRPAYGDDAGRGFADGRYLRLAGGGAQAPCTAAVTDPQVRTDERLLRQQLQAAQAERLSGYHWENPQKTLIGIPIERAMQLLATRGAAAYDPIVQQSDTTAQSPGPGTAAAMQNPASSVPSNGQPAQPQ